MGKLIKASKWIEQEFEKGSRPSAKKVAEWVENGDIPGRVIGGCVYVDADAYALGQTMTEQVEQPRSGAFLLH